MTPIHIWFVSLRLILDFFGVFSFNMQIHVQPPFISTILHLNILRNR